MFGRTHDALVAHAQHVLDSHRCHFELVFAKRTIIDHGVVRVVVHVYHWGKIHLDTQLFALLSHPATIPVHQTGVAQSAEHHHPGQTCNAVKPHANAIFSINGHEDGCFGN